jgi:diguanylate cyclase (GGDEF)-like protein
MLPDMNTVLFLVIATCFLVGSMLLLAWNNNRKEIAYLWWAGGFVIAGLGLAMIAGSDRGGHSGTAVGTLLVLIGLTFCWGGARTFDHRPINAWPVAIGLISWAVVNTIPPVTRSPQLQSAIMSCFLAFYSLAIGLEFWRGRGETLASRAPLAILCFVNGGVHLAHLALAWIPSDVMDAGRSDFIFATMLFQPALILVAGGLYGVGLGRDRVEQELRRAAQIDSLTGVLNRGALFERGEQLLAEAHRNNRALSVMLFDLDRFKDINDTLGHLAGDLVLQAFARIASTNLRASDAVGRIGGEEFCIVLPGATANGAKAIAERVRADFAANRITWNGQDIPATVSVGVVSMEGHHHSFDQLLSLADRALYGAKRSGRDKVVTTSLALAS